MREHLTRISIKAPNLIVNYGFSVTINVSMGALKAQPRAIFSPYKTLFRLTLVPIRDPNEKPLASKNPNDSNVSISGFIKVGNAWHSTLLPTPPKIGDSYSILKLSAY